MDTVGLMFFKARWLDPYLNCQTQTGSIVPPIFGGMNPHNPVFVFPYHLGAGVAVASSERTIQPWLPSGICTLTQVTPLSRATTVPAE